MHDNNIHYISHGSVKTGGYRHEMMLGNYLAQCFGLKLTVFRYPQQTKGLASFIKLWLYAFKQATANVQITVQRLAIPVMLACLFRRKSMILVWHHYHPQQEHSLFYHLNAKLVIQLLKSGWGAVQVVVVSEYWKTWLINKGVSEEQIHLIPNLYEVSEYEIYKTTIKQPKQICFGQYGVKQHPDIFSLISQLSALGFYCYFTTPNQTASKKAATYEVLHLSYKAYLTQLASSQYTVCFSAFPEGWNRLAHESLLVGTSVIGNDAGGLGLLLKEAQQPIISTPMQAISIIANPTNHPIPEAFLQRYDIKQISYYAGSLVVFCRHALR